jgi:hypothetical protein
MGSLDTSEPARSPALPDLPPISTRELTVGLTDLFSQADGLELPEFATISEPLQSFSLQFAPSVASYRAVADWARRFGASVTSSDHTYAGKPCMFTRAEFDFFGVAVTVHAFIRSLRPAPETRVPGLGDGHLPARPATTHPLPRERQRRLRHAQRYPVPGDLSPPGLPDLRRR